MDQDALFALLSHATRRRMLRLLLAEGGLCVCELCVALDADQPKVSRHLARMRAAGLVEDRRDAQWIVYRVAGAMHGALGALLAAADGLAAMTARARRAAQAA